MRKWAKRIFGGLVILILIVVSAGAIYQWLTSRKEIAKNPAPGKLVDIGGYKLHIWCEGSGIPTVILDTGLGGSMFDWGFVQPKVAEFTRVCSYDRAGMGYSDAGPTPRTSRQIAGELRILIQKSGINGPILLVGSSFGGLNMRAFAYEYGESVAGIVLVDASHEDQEERYKAVNAPEEVPWFFKFVPFAASVGVLRPLGFAPGLDPDSLAPRVRNFANAVRFRTSAYRAAVDELTHVEESGAEIRAVRHQLSMPVIVLSAGLSEEPQGRAQVWSDLQRSQVKLSSRGCQIIAANSHHVIAVEQPDVVVAAIRAIVDENRTKTNVSLCSEDKA
jgi:pimeloyl-ACP methyl ester carboxylesterase